jgi:pilus assembly protein Flp/PilA
MKSFVKRAKSFLKSEDGPTATEYAVMLALIIVISIAAIQTLGQKVSTAFSNADAGLAPIAS